MISAIADLRQRIEAGTGLANALRPSIAIRRVKRGMAKSRELALSDWRKQGIAEQGTMIISLMSRWYHSG
jgi:hypothetical protein